VDVSTIRGLFGKAASLLHLGRPRPPGTPITADAPTPPITSTTPTAPGTRPPETIGTGARAVRIEYTPRIDGDADPGEVVWTWVAYEDDPSQGKDRPVVVIGRRGTMLAAVALTSKRHDREPQVLVGRGPWDHEGRSSYAKVDRVIEVDPTAMRREGAILDHERFLAVVDGVRRHLED